MHVNGQCGIPISSFPYQEDFEATDGGWTSGGVADDWAWGMPSKAVINSAGGGLKCWISGGLGAPSYNGGERSFVKSPCFDFTGIANPYITFNLFWETEKQYDGAGFQYSLDGGVTWSNVGSVNDAEDCLHANWFNFSNILNISTIAPVNEGWSGNVQPTSGSCLGGLGSNGWLQAKHTMPYLAGEPQVMFRFIFGSGTTCNDYDGFAFDDVVIREAPAVPVISYQATQAGCAVPDGSLSISITGGLPPFNYAWSPNVSSGTQATSLAAGTYTVNVTDGTGCTTSLVMQVPAAPPVGLQVQASADTCGRFLGAATALASGGTPPFLYAWDNGSTTSSRTQLQAGTYTVTVTDAAGCTQEAEAAVDDTGYFPFSLGPDLVICGTSSKILNPGSFSSYLWQDGSTPPFYEIHEPGIYFVTVTSEQGCTATDTVTVIENCLNDMIVPGAFTPNGDGYNDVFSASGTPVTSFEMQVRNRWGSLVFVSSSAAGGWNGQVHGMDAPEGIYVWNIRFTIPGAESKEKIGTVLLLR